MSVGASEPVTAHGLAEDSTCSSARERRVLRKKQALSAVRGDMWNGQRKRRADIANACGRALLSSAEEGRRTGNHQMLTVGEMGAPWKPRRFPRLLSWGMTRLRQCSGGELVGGRGRGRVLYGHPCPGLCRMGRRAGASEAKRRGTTPLAGRFSQEVAPGRQRSPWTPIRQ